MAAEHCGLCGDNPAVPTPKSWPVRIFNDPVHRTMEIPSLFSVVHDKPEFQRLRNIQQLGSARYLYPTANHSRFEHSLGTSYLALKMIRHLKNSQPELEITENHVMCIAIAGLCHDIGHGPFSHMFDDIIVQSKRPDINWSHELGSIKIIDHMMKKYRMMADLHKEGLDLSKMDWHFIKELIYGPLEYDENHYDLSTGEYSGNYTKSETYQGKPEPEWQFLYEIVSNKTNGIDVDKFDYIARDCHGAGLSTTFNHDRLIMFSAVVREETNNSPAKRHIGFRDKERYNVYELFHVRSLLHRQVYQHPTTLAVNLMICDALLKADDHYQHGYENSAGQWSQCKMSETVGDMWAYCQLTDFVLEDIKRRRDVAPLRPSQLILDRVESGQRARNLYRKLEEEYRVPKDYVIKKTMLGDYEKEIARLGGINCEDISLQLAKFDYGMAQDNPVDSVLFFKKKDPYTAFKIEKVKVSYLLPEIFHEQFLYLYVKCQEKEGEAEIAFNKWIKSQYQAEELLKEDTSFSTPPSKRPGRVPAAHSLPDTPIKQSPFGLPASSVQKIKRKGDQMFDLDTSAKRLNK